MSNDLRKLIEDRLNENIEDTIQDDHHPWSKFSKRGGLKDLSKDTVTDEESALEFVKSKVDAIKDLSDEELKDVAKSVLSFANNIKG